MALWLAIADAKGGKKGAKPIRADQSTLCGKRIRHRQGGENKIGVEQTRINNWMRELNLGFASKGVVRSVPNPHPRGATHRQTRDVQHLEVCERAKFRSIPEDLAAEIS